MLGASGIRSHLDSSNLIDCLVFPARCYPNIWFGFDIISKNTRWDILGKQTHCTMSQGWNFLLASHTKRRCNTLFQHPFMPPQIEGCISTRHEQGKEVHRWSLTHHMHLFSPDVSKPSRNPSHFSCIFNQISQADSSHSSTPSHSPAFSACGNFAQASKLGRGKDHSGRSG